jgi:hypothetical protein
VKTVSKKKDGLGDDKERANKKRKTAGEGVESTETENVLVQRMEDPSNP